MSSPLRGAEIDACVHRVTLSRVEAFSAQRTVATPEMERRRREAEGHRREVLDALGSAHPDAVVARDSSHSVELVHRGVELILQPRLLDVADARRSVAVQAFIRVGRTDEGFSYAPLVVKNHEVVEPAITRRLAEGTLKRLLPADAVAREGLGLRTTPTVRRDELILAGATRVLQSLGSADPATRAVIIDRSSRLWWIDLSTKSRARSNLSAYDALYLERRSVLAALDQWRIEGGPFPTAPYWHRECLTCEFADHCEAELETTDDVSLTRFTSLEQQWALHEQGIHTRLDLARLDAQRAQRTRAKNLAVDEAFEHEDALVSTIDKLDELIYRARAHVRGTSMRIVESSQMGCPTADVEVDVDMESYDDATYLWGATVSVRGAFEGIESGHLSFVEWETLSEDAEAENFARFWNWLSELRARCHHVGATFAAYCFWAQAEDGAMSRAVSFAHGEGPTLDELESFRRHVPSEWIDLHELAKTQIQTEGPLGLKQLAGAAGFTWRDEHPSGEASMQWYEVARGDDVAAMISRQRILEYNEDDCRATRALREWLNGPARELPHRDDPL